MTDEKTSRGRRLAALAAAGLLSVISVAVWTGGGQALTGEPALAAAPDAIRMADNDFGGFDGDFGGGFGERGFEREGGEGAEGFAGMAMLALMINAAYIPYKLIKKHVPEISNLLGPLARFTLPVHCWAGVAALLFGTIHALTAEDSNPLLWAGLGLMAYETVAGIFLRAREVPKAVRRTAFLLHAQRFVFWAMLAALFFGHAFVGDGFGD